MNNNKHLTPLQSIRKYCLWCCDQQSKDVRLCPKSDCVFYHFKFGKKMLKKSTVKTIKLKCLDCGEGTAQAVRKCKLIGCPLSPYRNGKNPARKGIGGNFINR